MMKKIKEEKWKLKSKQMYFKTYVVSVAPMNLVKTKVAFSKMQSGQILGLVLDNGPPINNVPRSVIREGHEILLQEQLDDGAWSVLIRKA